MGSRTWQTLRQRDKDVLDGLSRIAEKVALPNPSTTIDFVNGLSSRANKPLTNIISDPDVAAALQLNDALLYRFHVALQPGIAAEVQRSPDSNVDKVILHFNEDSNRTDVIRVLAAVTNSFPTYERSNNVDKLLGDELAQFYRSREAAILKLESTAQKIIEETHAYRQKLTEQNDVLQSELKLEHAKQSTALEALYTSRSAELDQQKAQLDERAKALDDRDSRHARRALRVDLQNELAGRSKSFALTKDTRSKRLLIHGLFAVALCLDVALLGYLLLHAEGKFDLATSIRIGVGVIGFITVLILYIRWADLWFRQHADEEFRLKRLSLDVDRASWVVETALEWQQVNQSPIPDQLLNDLTRGLFTAGSRQDPVKHPAEDLAAALLNGASSLKIGPGAWEANLSGRGIRRANSTLKGAESSEG